MDDVRVSFYYFSSMDCMPHRNGADIWAAKEAQENKWDVAETGTLRWMRGIAKNNDRIRN